MLPYKKMTIVRHFNKFEKFRTYNLNPKNYFYETFITIFCPIYNCFFGCL
jgi:hypothetical protein